MIGVAAVECTREQGCLKDCEKEDEEEDNDLKVNNVRDRPGKRDDGNL